MHISLDRWMVGVIRERERERELFSKNEVIPDVCYIRKPNNLFLEVNPLSKEAICHIRYAHPPSPTEILFATYVAT